MPTLPPLLCHGAVTQASPPWGHRCGSLRAQPLRPSRAWSIEHTCLALRTVLSNRRGLEARVASFVGNAPLSRPGPSSLTHSLRVFAARPRQHEPPSSGCHHGSRVCVCHRAQLCVLVRAWEGVVVGPLFHPDLRLGGWSTGLETVTPTLAYPPATPDTVLSASLPGGPILPPCLSGNVKCWVECGLQRHSWQEATGSKLYPHGGTGLRLLLPRGSQGWRAVCRRH